MADRKMLTLMGSYSNKQNRGENESTWKMGEIKFGYTAHETAGAATTDKRNEVSIDQVHINTLDSNG